MLKTINNLTFGGKKSHPHRLTSPRTKKQKQKITPQFSVTVNCGAVVYLPLFITIYHHVIIVDFLFLPIIMLYSLKA